MPRKAKQHQPAQSPRGSQRHGGYEGRGSARERGYTWRWEKYRAAFLAQPENVICKAIREEDGKPCGRLATVVDHIKPHRGDQELFLDPANHQSLCKTCHDRKTARGE